MKQSTKLKFSFKKNRTLSRSPNTTDCSEVAAGQRARASNTYKCLADRNSTNTMEEVNFGVTRRSVDPFSSAMVH